MGDEMIQLMLRLEKHFSFPDDSLFELELPETLGQLHRQILTCLARTPGAAHYSEEAVWNIIRNEVSNIFHRELATITPDLRIDAHL